MREGMKNPSYWDFPVTKLGDKIYDFNSSVKLFIDKYGKKGTSQIGPMEKYPSGLDNHPVTGISWFEARAYAKFKNLTTSQYFFNGLMLLEFRKIL